MGFLETRNRRRAFAIWLLMSVRENNDLQVRPVIRKKTLQMLRRIQKTDRDLDREIILERYSYIDANAHLFYSATRQGTPSADGSNRCCPDPSFMGLIHFCGDNGVDFSRRLFSWSDPFINWIEVGAGQLSSWTRLVLPAGVLRDLITNGVIAGVGAVVGFLPQILFLFFFIAVLEGSGYLSRAAFLIDGIMRKIGLNGQAFVPMLSGLACAVPANYGNPDH